VKKIRNTQLLTVTITLFILARKNYNPVPILKLTTSGRFNVTFLRKRERQSVELLKEEAKTNEFKIMINNQLLF